jgi:hypothetical protein
MAPYNRFARKGRAAADGSIRHFTSSRAPQVVCRANEFLDLPALGRFGKNFQAKNFDASSKDARAKQEHLQNAPMGKESYSPIRLG